MNARGFQRSSDIVGDSLEDTTLLRDMAASARSYLTSFAWCPEIRETYLAAGVGGIVAVFLFEFNKPIQDTDDKLWVIVGDLPSAYMVVDPSDETPQEALEKYCELMEGWIQAVRSSSTLKAAFPVATEPTPENADLLDRRIAFLLAEVIPRLIR